MDMYTNETLVG